MDLGRFLEDVRERRSIFHKVVYRAAKKARGLDLPHFPSLAGLLYLERSLRKEAVAFLSNKFYYEQLLRSAAEEVGRNVRTDGDIPLIIGSGRIRIGDHVFLGNRQAWILQKNLFQRPELIIGSHTSINYRVVISVECRVEIGNRCRIAEEVKIFDNNSHSIHYQDRRQTIEDVAPVQIEDDAWIGMNSIILKGVRIGRGSVVAAGSVVTKSVPEETLVGGNPAVVIKRIR
ncbi:MAG: acyltransferase [bacterium]